MALSDFPPPLQVEVTLDGLPVTVPPDRSSFAAIRSFLESIALQHQRIVCFLSIDGEPINLTHPRNIIRPFTKIEAETMGLNEVPVQLIKAALQQAAGVRARLQSAVELVLINDADQARELWWSLATALKEPLLTLSLIPETLCGGATSGAGASLLQLRQWQLQQLGCVIKDVDVACGAGDVTTLSDAIEQRALPWLEKLCESLDLLNETFLSMSSAPDPQPA